MAYVMRRDYNPAVFEPTAPYQTPGQKVSNPTNTVDGRVQQQYTKLLEAFEARCLEGDIPAAHAALDALNTYRRNEGLSDHENRTPDEGLLRTALNLAEVGFEWLRDDELVYIPPATTWLKPRAWLVFETRAAVEKFIATYKPIIQKNPQALGMVLAEISRYWKMDDPPSYGGATL